MTTPITLLCFGFGYTAQHLASALHSHNHTETASERSACFIYGTTQSCDKFETIKKANVTPLLFSGKTDETEAIKTAIHKATHILISIAPDAQGDTVLRHYKQDIVNAPSLQWIGYLSATSVYGDHNGAWVDENTPPAPTSARGQRRVKAEQAWLDLYKNHQSPVHIFRLAGIYGTQRNVLEQIKTGQAKRIDKKDQVFSRIHVDDIARILIASIQQPGAGEIYNVCDNDPAASHDVTAYGCQLLGAEVPPLIPYEDADLSPMAQSFYADNKRVKNTKIKTELGVSLKFPDYKAGLDSLFKQMHTQQDAE